jgi:flagellar biosynthesis protein FlhF
MKHELVGAKHEYFIEQGASYREAHQKVLNQYGERAKILTQKQTRVGGIFGLFAKDVVEVQGYITKDPIQKRMNPSLEEEKRKVLESAKKELPKPDVTDTLLQEIRDLKAFVQINKEATRSSSKSEHDQLFSVFQDLMMDNEFTRTFTNSMITRMKKELSLEDLQHRETAYKKVLEWIESSIQVHSPKKSAKPHIFILVGPTGVGKTTTIAKLAAMHRLGIHGSDSKREVRILTIDNYRIGARQQIETYGEIMEIPVNAVETTNDLSKYLNLYANSDIIFIDTIGKSPKDYATLGNMKSLLSAAGTTAEVHLAMSATTKATDMAEIMQQFEPFGYESVIITKMDETNHVGAIISSLSEKRKSISFLTNGQTVPHDIKRAEPKDLVRCILGLQPTFTNKQLFEQEEIQKV